MNFMTRIALSLSLIALIAQPVQAASYADHAKKAGRIAWYAAVLYSCANSLYGIRNLPKSIDFYKGLHDSYVSMDMAKFLADQAIYKTIAVPVLLNYSIKGLHKEICPDFNPITWIKNKFSKKFESIA